MTFYDKMKKARHRCDEFSIEQDVQIELDLETPFEKTNGILMGDPGTKGLLTLMSLLANDEAHILVDAEKTETFDHLIEFENSTDFHSHFVVSLRRGWEAHVEANREGKAPRPFFSEDDFANGYRPDRKAPSLFSTAGDDQAAIGSLAKLRAISECHRKNSMVISEEKDLLSPILLLYCEKAALRTTQNRIYRPFESNGYDGHMVVDNLKMRLFSPESKVQDCNNDTNPAVGKARALAKLAKQLPVGWREIRDKYCYTRFKQRMFNYLPKLKNGFIDPIVELPPELGGLGLRSNGKEILEVLMSLSENHARAIALFFEKDNDSRVVQILNMFSRDRYARGARFDANDTDLWFEELDKNLKPPPLGLYATANANGVDLGNDLGYFAKRETLTSKGFVGDKELKSLFSRSALQTKLLTEKTTSGWISSTWESRRRAFENSLSELFERRENEGRSQFEGPVNRAYLADVMEREWDNVPSFVFYEERFYHKDMETIGYQFDNDDASEASTIVHQPIKELLTSLATLELPPINDKGWYPRKRTKQTSPEAGEI